MANSLKKEQSSLYFLTDKDVFRIIETVSKQLNLKINHPDKTKIDVVTMKKDEKHIKDLKMKGIMFLLKKSIRLL